MTLTTHAVAGALVASIFPSHPVIAFTLAFASHFLMDSIPHWSYDILSDTMNPNESNKYKIDKKFVYDILRIGSDALLGIILSLVLFTQNHNIEITSVRDWVIFGGALAGILPDALQFVYSKWHHEPLISLQKFHVWVHHDAKITKTHTGVISQILIIFCLAFLGKIF